MADQTDWVNLFRAADVNKDGRLTIHEIHAAMKKVGYPGDIYSLKGFFFDCDSSGDRRVSLDEFMVAMEKAPRDWHVAARLRTVFSHFDKSGDGEINAAELQRALGELGTHLPDSRIQKIMAHVDKDRSGTINIEEFVQMIQSGSL